MKIKILDNNLFIHNIDKKEKYQLFNKENSLKYYNLELINKSVLNYDLKENKLNLFKSLEYGKFKIKQKAEIRYFQGNNNDTIIEITNYNKLNDYYILNYEIEIYDTNEIIIELENKITLDLLKNNLDTLKKIFINNASLKDNDKELRFKQQKETFFNYIIEKGNYKINEILYKNYTNLKYNNYVYGIFDKFYQHYFIKKGTSLYPIKLTTKDGILNYEIIGKSYNIYEVFKNFNGFYYKENEYNFNPKFINLNDLII